jgi:hypothetical protein
MKWMQQKWPNKITQPIKMTLRLEWMKNEQIVTVKDVKAWRWQMKIKPKLKNEREVVAPGDYNILRESE